MLFCLSFRMFASARLFRRVVVVLVCVIMAGFLLTNVFKPHTITDVDIRRFTPNCSKLFLNDAEEIAKAKSFPAVSSSGFNYSLLQNCSEFRRRRKYITDVTEEEQDFPIAFSILMFKDFEQVERLLRKIYRPQNYYCIHVDSKSTPIVKDQVKRLTSCLPNVFQPSKEVNVMWGKFSVLEAELVCIKDLLRYKKWRYFINLTGQEFPLKTNLQVVHILKAYRGANDIEGTIKRISDRRDRWGRAGTPPHGLRAVKGAVHIVANRQFVEYAVTDPVAEDLLRWVRRTKIPDETFFATLNHNPQLGIPGTYIGEPETDDVKKPFLARYKVWQGGKLFRDECKGKYVHQICIFGVGDLHRLAQRRELFANKFHLTFQPAALQCMEGWYDDLVEKERNGLAPINESFYGSLGFVKHRVVAH